MTELKKALQAKIKEFEGYKTHPNYQSAIEKNAILVALRELQYLDSITEFENMEGFPDDNVANLYNKLSGIVQS